MDPYAIVFIVVVCLFAVGFAGNIADTLASPFRLMVAPLVRIADSLEKLAKSQSLFDDCGDPNCVSCNPDGEYVDDELNDSDFNDPDTGGDDFRHPPRKG